MNTSWCHLCCKEVRLKKDGTMFKHGHKRLGLYKLSMTGHGYFMGEYIEDRPCCNSSGKMPFSYDKNHELNVQGGK